MAPRPGIVVAVAAAVGLSAAPAAAAAPASVRLAGCHTSEDAEARYADFAGRMRAVPGTARMEMRFTVLQKLGAGGFARVDIPQLRAWRESRPGVRAFNYTQRVSRLREGGRYRVVVRFRWLDASGRALAEAKRRSPVCSQAGALPNLEIVAIVARPGELRGSVAYSVTLRNSGRAAARRPRVELIVDGAELDERGVDLLPPGASAVLAFTGPSCRRVVVAAADPDRAVAEADELDNRFANGCPAGSSRP